VLPRRVLPLLERHRVSLLSLVLLSPVPLSSLLLRNLLLRSECSRLVVLSPVAHSTVRRVRYLRVCSRCILRIVSVVPSDRAILDRVILDRALNVR